MGSDHRTTSLAVDGPRAAATDGEAKAIKSLLIRDIKDFDQSVPAVVRHDSRRVAGEDESSGFVAHAVLPSVSSRPATIRPRAESCASTSRKACV